MDVCIYTTYQIKKCVYIIKQTCVFMCVYGVVLINILVLQLGPPKQKFLAPPLSTSHNNIVVGEYCRCTWSRCYIRINMVISSLLLRLIWPHKPQQLWLIMTRRCRCKSWQENGKDQCRMSGNAFTILASRQALSQRDKCSGR